MRNDPGLIFLNIHNNIKEHFSFLLKRGFHITSAMFLDNSAENWVVTMLDDDWFIKLRCDQGHVNLDFTNLQFVDEVGFLSFSNTLKLIGKGDDEFYSIRAKHMNEQEQVGSLAHLFKRYFNELITQFDDLDPAIPDPDLSNLAYNENGQLSIDNCPFSFPV